MNKMTSEFIVRFLSEFIGTFFFLFLGCMGCIATDTIPNSNLQKFIAFGLVIMAMVQSFAVVSGGHLNPAVSISAFIYKRITLPMLGVYVFAQMCGATAGYGMLTLLVPHNAIKREEDTWSLCTTVPRNDISLIQAVMIEFLVTAVLILICCSVWDPRNAQFLDSVSLKFGFAVTMLCCAAGPWTGCSMNPARTLGPALINGEYESQWIYWVGPIAAAVLTTLLYNLVFSPKYDLVDE